MVSKLSENGMAGFILANGALSGGGEEYKIRRKLIENNLVEAILVLPRNLFYTTDISVTLWILNKNKRARTKNVGDETRVYRDRQSEILFMDLRQMGEPFEKKYTQFTDADIRKIAQTYHSWQTVRARLAPAQNTVAQYENQPEFCYSVSFDEVKDKDFSLVPSKYIEFVNHDEQIDFDKKMTALKTEIADLLQQQKQSEKELLKVFKELGYGIE
jgi:type I restriction enzyme M protein